MGVISKYEERSKKVNSLLCVGLDSDFEKIPERFRKMVHPQFEFNKYIIEETHEFVAAYKPNSAFYEARGDAGVRELKMTMDYLRQEHPDIFTIDDAKRGDMGNTNTGYVTSIFDWFGFDAVTVHPYLGKEALAPFLDRKDKMTIVLCRTSNPGSGELQNLEIGGKPLWQIVAEKVSKEWDVNKNCMLVVGATYTEEMKKIREIAPDMTFLVPGIGAQGGDVAQTLAAGLTKKKNNLIINSSRSVIFSEHPRAEAKKLRDEINSHR
jgi:orotidine 5'-phosphate decarboxylase subfamily 2